MTFNSDSYDEEQFSFELDAIEGLSEGKFYFKHDEKGNFVKLGDGTFGIVFTAYKVEGHNFKDPSYAVKLLYEPDETDDQKAVVKNRFEQEITASRDISRQLKQEASERKGLSDDVSNASYAAENYVGIIRTVGGTRSFKSSPIYKNFQSIFDDLGTSSYALVLPLYETDLKLLLEAVIKDVTTAPEKKKYDTGYDVLRRMGFDDRIRTILPYVRQVAEGLRTLHKSGYCHLDVKPSNVYIRQRGDNIEAVIADLGFLAIGDQAKVEPTLVPGNRGNRPLGTRHYRSPEQKDYFDIADAELIVDSNKKSVRLIVRDSKFRDTIIDDADAVFFSKYKVQREIKSINPNNQDGVAENGDEEAPINVTLVPKNGNGKLDEKLGSDKRTQVIFYKRQEYRTDLFGFGAVIFDLLTCGKSPEIFYEMIRSYDSPSESVKQIIDQYIQVSRFRSVEPGLLKLFEPFRLQKNSTIYAPHEIVELILKCMLYRANGTFYKSRYENQKAPNEVMEQVIEELENLSHEYPPVVAFAKNYLYLQQFPAEHSFEELTFQKSLKHLQELDKNKFPQRLSQGIVYLSNLIRFLSDSYREESEELGFFFAELQPQNLVIPSAIKPDKVLLKHILYEKKDGYEQDLVKDLVYTKINGNPSNSFTPPFFTFMRREVCLQLMQDSLLNRSDNPMSSEPEYWDQLGVDQSRTHSAEKMLNHLIWHCEFSDSSFYDDKISEGDWLILKPHDHSRNILFSIHKLDQIHNTFQLKVKDGADIAIKSLTSLNNGNYPLKNNLKVPFVYYRNINPCTYYLYMVGTYIYSIFFAGLDGNDFDRLLLNLLTGMSSSHEISELHIQSQNSFVDNLLRIARTRYLHGKTYEDFRNIVNSLMRIYLRLIFPDSAASYWQRTKLQLKAMKRPIDLHSREFSQMIFSLVEEDIQKLSEAIVRFVSRNSFNDKLLGTQQFDEYLKDVSLSNLIGRYTTSLNLNFDNLVVDRLHIKTTAKGRFLKKLKVM